jgi:hypothetical protein
MRTAEDVMTAIVAAPERNRLLPFQDAATPAAATGRVSKMLCISGFPRARAKSGMLPVSVWKGAALGESAL